MKNQSKVRRKRIGFKILTTFIPIIIISAITLSCTLYTKSKKDRLTLSTTDISQISNDMAALSRKNIVITGKKCRDMANTIIAYNMKDEKEIINFINDNAKQSKFKAIAFVDLEGNYTDSNGNTSNVKNADCIKTALVGLPSVSDIYISSVDGKPEVAYCVPIVHTNGIGGVIVGIQDCI